MGPTEGGPGNVSLCGWSRGHEKAAPTQHCMAHNKISHQNDCYLTLIPLGGPACDQFCYELVVHFKKVYNFNIKWM